MALSSTGVRITYYANGVVVDFTFPFAFIDDTDIEVYVDGEQKNLGPDFSVSYLYGETYANGGVVHFNWLPDNGQIIVVRRSVPATQPTQYGLLESYTPEQIEADLDRRAMVEQQLLDMLARCLIYPMAEDPPNRELPSIDDRAGNGLIFDIDGNIIVGSFYSGDPASTWGKSLIDDTDAAEGRGTLGVTAMDDLVVASSVAAAMAAIGVTVSTSDPSGTPEDGELWLKREA